jgi:thiol-disulfide isomerase/thioredoxin
MNKTTTNRIIAIFIGILMVGSTATYALMQAFNYFGTNKQTNVSLPSSYIVQEQLTDDQEKTIMSEYKTVVQFYYSTDCLNCIRQRNVLENFVNQNSGQIYLEEIQTKNQVPQNIVMKSYRDTRLLANATQSDIENGFCDVLLQPPAQCALRNLNTS